MGDFSRNNLTRELYGISMPVDLVSNHIESYYNLTGDEINPVLNIWVDPNTKEPLSYNSNILVEVGDDGKLYKLVPNDTSSSNNILESNIWNSDFMKRLATIGKYSEDLVNASLRYHNKLNLWKTEHPWENFLLDAPGYAMMAGLALPGMVAAAPMFAPGTMMGNLIGTTTGGMASGMISNGIYRTITGSPNGYMHDLGTTLGADNIQNPYLRKGVRFGLDLLDPAYYTTAPIKGIVKTGLLLFGNSPVLFGNKMITPVTLQGLAKATIIPGLNTEFTIEGVPYTRTTRPLYWELDPDFISTLKSIPKKAISENVKLPKYIQGYPVIGTKTFDRMPYFDELLEMIAKERGINLDMSQYPTKTYYVNAKGKAFERTPEIDGKKAILLTHGGLPESVYTKGHIMWDDIESQLSKETISDLYKIFRNAPLDNLYSPESRAYSIIKEMLARISDRFLDTFKTPFKDYAEFVDYVDDLPDEYIEELIRKSHGGHWLENGNLSIKDIEKVRKALTYKNGGTINKLIRKYPKRLDILS